MSAFAGTEKLSGEIEDPLQYLPRGVVSEIGRGGVIYDENHPAAGIYLLSRGRAALSLGVHGQTQRVVVEICSPEQFLGFASLIYGDRYAERATALDNCTVMFWPGELVEQQIHKQPRLGVALVQMLVQRLARFNDRLESLTGDSTTDRLARLLLMLGADCGSTGDDGWLHMPAFTHQILADCIGTSREVVTSAMNRLRREAYLTYTRRGIAVSEAAIRERLQSGRQSAQSAG
jgi:CRP/FNR family transcriptional regulator